MMVVVGRPVQGESRRAMSIDELSYLAQQLGMTDALNLDGGGSATLWNNHTGIINHPTTTRSSDHEGEREVVNAIVALPQ